MAAACRHAGVCSGWPPSIAKDIQTAKWCRILTSAFNPGKPMRNGWPSYIVGRSRSGGLTLPRLPSVLLRGVSASGGRGTVAADLLRRMVLAEPSLLLGVLCTLRLSFETPAAAALPPLIRDSEFLQRPQTSVNATRLMAAPEACDAFLLVALRVRATSQVQNRRHGFLQLIIRVQEGQSSHTRPSQQSVRRTTSSRVYTKWPAFRSTVVSGRGLQLVGLQVSSRVEPQFTI